MKKVPLKDGFDYNGVWITNPHYEETGRFKFDTEYDAAIYYGFPKNLHALWVATLKPELSEYHTADTLDVIARGLDKDADCDNFIYDVIHYDWKSNFTINQESLAEFNAGVMRYLVRSITDQANNNWGTFGGVIISAELFDWAEKYFNV